jgi:hypothetical protein
MDELVNFFIWLKFGDIRYIIEHTIWYISFLCDRIFALQCRLIICFHMHIKLGHRSNCYTNYNHEPHCKCALHVNASLLREEMDVINN